jgi:general secretion pathway protein K
MDNKRGSILIIILWSLFFLSALSLAISGYIRPRLDLGSRLLRRTKMHYYAKAGIKQAMLKIEKDDTPLHDCLDDGWNTDSALERTEVEDGIFAVELVDEERKINVNTAPYDILKKFFEIAGQTSSEDAGDLADSIIDWRDEDDDTRDDGAEDGYYSMLKPGYDCKNSDFEIIEELLLVKGDEPGAGREGHRIQGRKCRALQGRRGGSYSPQRIQRILFLGGGAGPNK